MWYFTSNFQKNYAREKLPESLCNPILTPYAVNLCYVYPAKQRRQNNQSRASDATCERDRSAFPHPVPFRLVVGSWQLGSPTQASSNRWEPVWFDRLPVKSVWLGFGLGRYQIGPNSKFKFKFKKMKNS